MKINAMQGCVHNLDLQKVIDFNFEKNGCVCWRAGGGYKG